MTEIEQKAVEKMADRIGKFYNYQITQSDTYELAKFLYAAGYRKQSETVKEFAEKLKFGMARFGYYYCGSNGVEYFGDIQVNDFNKMIKELAEQYGKE